MKYDVIVIGSGLGGLICARQLAKAGRSVLVLERHTQPGGCLQTYRRDGMTFDTGLHYVGGLDEGQSLHRLFSELGLLHLPWQHLDADGFDLVTIGGQTFPYREGYNHFAETLAAYFPKERDALHGYVQMLQNEKLRIKNEEFATAIPSAEGTPVGNYSLFTFHSSLSTNAYDYLTTTFRNPLLINVLSGTALKMELRRESLPLFTFAHSQSSYIQSSWRLRGGGSQIVQSLTDDIERFGGTIVCGAEVSELKIHEGRVRSALCKVGDYKSPSTEHYEADIFISDLHPQQTFGMIHQDGLLKPTFRRRINQLENTFGMFTASLILKPNALPYFNHNKYVYRKPNVWTFHTDVGGVGGVMVSCSVPNDDSGYTRQVDLLTPVPWLLCQQCAHTRIGHRGADYLQIKQQLADACIHLAETVIPGLGSMVAHRYTSTPLTWRDYTHTPNGSAYGLRKDCRQPLFTVLSPRTPIPNLLLTGQSLMLHGVEGVAQTAFQTIEAYHKLTNS